MKVSVYEAKSKLSQMINKALEGEEVVITRHGEDTVKLTPVTKKRDWIGMWKGQIEIKEGFYEPLDDETLGYFTGDADTFLDKMMRADTERENEKE